MQSTSKPTMMARCKGPAASHGRGGVVPAGLDGPGLLN